MPRADVLWNPISGSSARARALDRFRGALERGGWEVRLLPTAHAGHAPALARQAAAEGAAAVVAAGGDGTINQAAEGLLACGADAPPLAVLARGTSNLVARELGIPFDPEGAAGVVLGGATRVIDVARAGPRPMVACAGAGWDAHVVRELAARRTGHIQVSTWFGPIRSALRNYGFPVFRVTPRGGTAVECVLALFLNCRPYAKYFVPAPGARPDDGVLDALVVRPEGRGHLGRIAWRAWRGRMAADPDVVALRGAEFTVESTTPVPLQVDGDPGGDVSPGAPLRIAVRPAALRVLVPRAGG